MNFTAEQEEKIFKLSTIYASIVWWLLVCLALFALIYFTIKAIKQNKYYGTLTPQERDVIYKYNNVKVFERKKHDLNNSNNSSSNN